MSMSEMEKLQEELRIAEERADRYHTQLWNIGRLVDSAAPKREGRTHHYAEGAAWDLRVQAMVVDFIVTREMLAKFEAQAKPAQPDPSRLELNIIPLAPDAWSDMVDQIITLQRNYARLAEGLHSFLGPSLFLRHFPDLPHA
jgi:hypothetical protein